MRVFDHFDLAIRGVVASVFSLLSNTVSIFVGLLFFGLLMALSIGVGDFLEKYYSRTVSLTTILAFHSPGGQDFDSGYRRELSSLNGVERVFYHDNDFVDIQLSQDKSVTVALRSAVPNDPEIERLELVAGSNLPAKANALQPAVILPVLRAQQLTDVSPEKLIGAQIAITFLRGSETEEEFDSASVYGTIVGIVNETPNQSVYVHYSVLAMVKEWMRPIEHTDLNSRNADDGGIEEAKKKPTPERSELPGPPEPPGPVAGTQEKDEREERADNKNEEGSLKNNPGLKSESDASFEHSAPETGKPPRHVHPTLESAWKSVHSMVADDSIIYPHLRIHMKDVESLVDVRNHFRRSGIATTSSLDDIAAIRELRNYALMIGTAIGFITLISAACSIFNTLIASVERRTREIGILRALGASGMNVLVIFLLEGAINALFGGAIAAVCLVIGGSVANSWMLAELSQNEEFAKVAELEPELFAVPHWLPLILIALGVGISFLASLLPAIRACFIEPTAALRHE